MFDDFLDDDEFIEDGDNTAAPASGGASLPPPSANPDLYGHEANEKALLELYNDGKLPHALIFSGPFGVGKATAAFRLARFLLKHGAGGDDNQDSLFGDAPAKPDTLFVPMDDPVARKIAAGGHPDLRYIERPIDVRKGVKKTGVDVDSIREIAPFLRMTTAEGGWRIVIVDEAETMTRQAQNAVLKILEEPPPQSLIILVCARLGSMIPTIRSRCRTFHFAPLKPDTMSNLMLRAAPEASKSELIILSDLSDGSVGRATVLHQEEGVNALHSFIAFAEGWPDFNWEQIHPWADNLSKPGMEKAYDGFVTVAEWTIRTMTMCKALARPLPAILATEPMERLLTHYSLEQWVAICEKLKEHFIAINVSNLDKHQGVIGAFTILGGRF